ncbi:DegT/DnrJ/EryC1/StrS family aminotransferase [Patescibacteria group bacterium]|nr:DegT/DnrJ/EryC1/StrS family aminotransferase [Patescibacteria group bacterium]MBU1722126.1 DegT/DnrJ/EryC1/StrS family aminotransferase [Patescibacteria group bacterium]MBU1901175.1 DegT/DnrJ/EryC1/StrS family aminotransferase [Patescibacteria group bacterium]
MYPIARPYIKLSLFFSLFQFWKYFGNTSIIEFESIAKNVFDRTYAVAYSSGRVAIQKLFEAKQIVGQDVAIPSYTCIVVPYAVELSGNNPIFVEPSDRDFTVPISELSQHAGIVIQTHMFGEVQEFVSVPDNVFIIEDSCLAVGSSCNGYKAGTIGDVSVFSFNQSKQLGGIGGGVLLTDDKKLYEKLKSNQECKIGFINECKNILKLLLYWVYYKKWVYTLFKSFGLSKKNDDNFSLKDCTLSTDCSKGLSFIEMRVNTFLLKHKDVILKERKKIEKWYDLYLGEIKGVKRFVYSSEMALSHCWLILNKNRDIVRKKLYSEGINTGIANEYSCPTTPYYKDKYEPSLFKNTTHIGDSIINLPYYIGLKKTDVAHICAVFKRIYEEI